LTSYRFIHIFALFLVILSPWFLGGCTAGKDYTGNKGSRDKMTVYTTIYPLYDFAAKVGGDKIKIKTILSSWPERKRSGIFSRKLLSVLKWRRPWPVSCAKTLVLNPMDGLTGEDIAAGRDYLYIMRENLKNLKMALGVNL